MMNIFKPVLYIFFLHSRKNKPVLAVVCFTMPALPRCSRKSWLRRHASFLLSFDCTATIRGVTLL